MHVRLCFPAPRSTRAWEVARGRGRPPSLRSLPPTPARVSSRRGCWPPSDTARHPPGVSAWCGGHPASPAWGRMPSHRVSPLQCTGMSRRVSAAPRWLLRSLTTSRGHAQPPALRSTTAGGRSPRERPSERLPGHAAPLHGRGPQLRGCAGSRRGLVRSRSLSVEPASPSHLEVPAQDGARLWEGRRRTGHITCPCSWGLLPSPGSWPSHCLWHLAFQPRG